MRIGLRSATSLTVVLCNYALYLLVYFDRFTKTVGILSLGILLSLSVWLLPMGKSIVFVVLNLYKETRAFLLSKFVILHSSFICT